VIAETVESLLRQSYPHFELVVLDDHSTDDTVHLAHNAAGDDPRFSLFSGKPLPPGWTGKNWACHQLAGLAHGEILVFTDADVRWHPAALQAVVAGLQSQRADMLTVWPRQITRTWTERLVVPLINFVVLAYLPELAVRRVPGPLFAAANGQALAFTRGAYARSGGHASVRTSVLDDVSLARAAKSSGLRLVMFLSQHLMATRMYSSWTSVRDGFAKNILAGYGGAPLFLLLATIFHWALFILPWGWLAWSLLSGGTTFAILASTLLIAIGLSARLIAAILAGDSPKDILFTPISVVLMTLIAARALHWHFGSGGPQWKGRGLRQDPAHE
jgi:chlorobactene glucosyltransferase